MNYGDRQERAEMLVRAFRSQGTKVFNMQNRAYTSDQIANEIECMTDLGKELVAVAGLVLQAMLSTPDLFRKKTETTS